MERDLQFYNILAAKMLNVPISYEYGNRTLELKFEEYKVWEKNGNIRIYLDGNRYFLVEGTTRDSIIATIYDEDDNDIYLYGEKESGGSIVKRQNRQRAVEKIMQIAFDAMVKAKAVTPYALNYKQRRKDLQKRAVSIAKQLNKLYLVVPDDNLDEYNAAVTTYNKAAALLNMPYFDRVIPNDRIREQIAEMTAEIEPPKRDKFKGGDVVNESSNTENDADAPIKTVKNRTDAKDDDFSRLGFERIKETERAYSARVFLNFSKSGKYNPKAIWFPKSHAKLVGDKVYPKVWILKRKVQEIKETTTIPFSLSPYRYTDEGISSITLNERYYG